MAALSVLVKFSLLGAVWGMIIFGILALLLAGVYALLELRRSYLAAVTVFLGGSLGVLAQVALFDMNSSLLSSELNATLLVFVFPAGFSSMLMSFIAFPTKENHEQT